MGMNMKNSLPGITIGVEHNPIPRLENPLELRNPPSSERNSGQQPRIPSSKLPQVPIPNLGHNKHMNLGLRPNIPEGKGQIILIDNISRDLTSNDPFKESLILTHEERPYRRRKTRHPTGTERGRGGPGHAPAGVWGSDPQKTQRTRSGPTTEAKRGRGPRSGRPWGSIYRHRGGRRTEGGGARRGLCFPSGAPNPETVCGALVNESNGSECDRAITGRKIGGLFSGDLFTATGW
ncbi:Uncharacterised protein [Amycolatopsis camponoti]|uniref:Uncharacterized protein n=1 Tax=Amycolatopsis camponoti TaxID=2606593 RepID=A0A6I8LU51_9PSEU|nr:Uncharacterised protein [Amycolatopsis camponoti]